jgi:hypothetical protein
MVVAMWLRLAFCNYMREYAAYHSPWEPGADLLWMPDF